MYFLGSFDRRVVRQTGISDEAILAGGYNMLSGHVLQDVASVPAMMKNGLLEPSLPRTVDEVGEIKSLFGRCEEKGGVDHE